MGEKHIEPNYYAVTENGYVPCGAIREIEPLSLHECIERILDHLAKVTPKRILKSGNRTIVFWSDNTKTIVKRAEDEAESDYAAFTAALGIKLFGSNSALKKLIESKTEVQKPKKQKEED